MSGLDLSANRSGESSDRAVPLIYKNGKADLRYALYQAALIASIRNQHFVVYFTEELRGREREQGIKTKMRVKLHIIQVVLSVVGLLRGRKIELNRSRVNVEKIAPLYRFIQKETR